MKNPVAGVIISRSGESWQATKEGRNAHFTQWQRVFVKREVNTQMANIVRRCLTFLLSYSIIVHWGEVPQQKCLPERILRVSCNQTCSGWAVPVLSLYQHQVSLCLLWPLLVPGVFIPLHGCHFVCNPGVPKCSSWASCFSFLFSLHPTLDLLHLFSPPSLPLLPDVSLLSLKHYFLSASCEAESVPTVWQSHSECTVPLLQEVRRSHVPVPACLPHFYGSY